MRGRVEGSEREWTGPSSLQTGGESDVADVLTLPMVKKKKKKHTKKREHKTIIFSTELKPHLFRGGYFD